MAFTQLRQGVGLTGSQLLVIFVSFNISLSLEDYRRSAGYRILKAAGAQ